MTSRVSTLKSTCKDVETDVSIVHGGGGVAPYQVTNSSLVLQASPTTSSEPTDMTTSIPDLSNVYMQRPRTTSSSRSISASTCSNSSSTNSSFYLSNGSSSSSISSSSNGTTSISSTYGATAPVQVLDPTTPTSANCSGTMTFFRPIKPTKTYTVTENYTMTIFGTSTDYTPPPISTPLPFCRTITFPLGKPSPSVCSGTDPCITFHFTTTLASAAIPLFASTHKITQVVFVDPSPPPSFGTTPAVEPQPARTASVVGSSEPGANTHPASTAQPAHSSGIGGIIASIFNNPFTSQKPSPSPATGGSSAGGVSSGGSGSSQGSPGSGSANGQSPSQAESGSSNDSPQGGGSAGGSSSNGASPSNQRPPQTVNPSGDLLNGGAESTQSPSQQHASTPDATIFDDILVSIAASQVVIGGETFPTGATPTTLAIDGQTFSINPSQIIAPGITLDISRPASVVAAPSPPTVASVFLAITSNGVLISGQTFTAGSSPTSTVINGQIFAINPSQRIALGTATTNPSSAPTVVAPNSLTIANIPIAIQSNNVVINGQTFSAGSSLNSTVINGHMFTINPSQVIAAGTTIDIPSASAVATLSAVTAGGFAFSVAPNVALISGTTYSIGKDASPTTKVIGDKTVSFGPNGVGFESATVPALGVASPSPSAVTAGGLTFVVAPNVAVISGTTYSVGKNASPTTKVIGDKTLSFGPNGVGFASTTVLAPSGASSSPSAVTAGGLTFSVGSTAAVISGTTYVIGSGASPTTKVIGGQTVSFGPNGVGFASTTIPVPTASGTGAASPGLELFTGSASDLGIKGAAMGTILAFGVGILFVL